MDRGLPSRQLSGNTDQRQCQYRIRFLLWARSSRRFLGQPSEKLALCLPPQAPICLPVLPLRIPRRPNILGKLKLRILRVCLLVGPGDYPWLLSDPRFGMSLLGHLQSTVVAARKAGWKHPGVRFDESIRCIAAWGL